MNMKTPQERRSAPYLILEDRSLIGNVRVLDLLGIIDLEVVVYHRDVAKGRV